jgi:exopolysaccharide biosynthesis polyprenyl glycosylphosphotransferase
MEQQHIVVAGRLPSAARQSARSPAHRARLRVLEASLMLEAVLAVAAAAAVSWAISGPSVGIVVGLTVWTGIAYHAGVTILRPTRAQVRTLLRSSAVGVSVVAVAASLHVLPDGAVAAALVAVATASVVAAVGRLVRRRLRGPVRTLIVGDSVAVGEWAYRWHGERSVDIVAACIFEPDLNADEYPSDVLGAPVLRSLDDLPAAIMRADIENVIVAPGPGFSGVDLRRLAWLIEGTPAALGVVGALDSVAPHRIAPGRIGGSIVLDVAPSRRSGFARACKGMVDRALGLLVLVLCSPILGALWLGVRLDSKGPGFFAQERVGEHGRIFKMYKFRTMTADAETLRADLAEANQATGPLFKIRHDPRVTRLGQILRRSSLDELPQLVNVVKGDMSLVGPRPALPSEVDTYDQDARRRLAVKPGLTGLWQVSGRADLGWDESVALDLHYVDNWRLSDDVVIALRTVHAVVRARGAY